MIRHTLVLLAMTWGPVALAQEPAPAPAPALESLKGPYAFDKLSTPGKQKCVRVDAKLLKELEKRYQCAAETTQSASGKPSVLCTREDEKKQYAILETKALCDEERQTQAANGEE